jgi:3-methyladenine DNA glycosylase/8-oxoguanine DNA glycosylase
MTRRFVQYHGAMILTLDTPSDFSFTECMTAHGWRQLLPFWWAEDDGGALERVEDFGGGNIVVLRITGGHDHVKIAVNPEAAIAPAAIVNRVSCMLQLNLDMAPFHSYCAKHEKLGHIPRLAQGRMLRSPGLFEDIVKVIATTNTTWAQTKSMVQRIVDTFGTPCVYDSSRRTFPRPEQIASVSAQEFAEKANMGYRSGAVHKIATDISESRLVLTSFTDPGLSTPDLFKKLLTLPGIGPYAASCLLIYLGRYDRVNVDSWARTLVGKELGRPVTDKEVHAFFENYGEWKALVYHFYQWSGRLCP